MASEEDRFHDSINVNEKTTFQDVFRTVSVHVHPEYLREFTLAVSGGGFLVHIDLPIAVLAELIPMLERVRAHLEKRGMLAAIARTADAARFHEVATGYVEKEIVE